jgi:predicted double-glycine peptidase
MGVERSHSSEKSSLSDQTLQTSGVSHEQTRANLAQFATMLETQETPAVHSNETADKLKSAGVKGVIAAVATAGVMGVTSLLHAEKVEEFIPPPIEPAPVEQIVEAPTPAFNLDQAEVSEPREMTFVETHVETAERSWWHDVPATSQQPLVYQGRETDYGCAPTAVSMVTEYWHQQDPNNETSSAQELLDKNVEQGIFKGSGMSVTYIHDELSALGYAAEDHSNATLETLKHEVSKGPVIAAVKLNMRTDGTNHSVVVTGISENNEVRVNDPWTGEARTYRWETFNASWGTLGRWLTTVQPT